MSYKKFGKGKYIYEIMEKEKLFREKADILINRIKWNNANNNNMLNEVLIHKFFFDNFDLISELYTKHYVLEYIRVKINK